MNLNNQPSVNALAELFATRKDSLDNHILWINETGDVHLDPLPCGEEETRFEEQHPQMRARLKMYRRGHGYVGKKAAADKEYLERVLQTLSLSWKQAQTGSTLVKVNSYS